MVRTEEDGLLRQKTQVGGRSSRAVVARPMVCSALGGESRGDRENPESNGLDLNTSKSAEGGSITSSAVLRESRHQTKRSEGASRHQTKRSEGEESCLVR